MELSSLSNGVNVPEPISVVPTTGKPIVWRRISVVTAVNLLHGFEINFISRTHFTLKYGITLE